MKLGRLLADELARIFWQKGTYVDYTALLGIRLPCIAPHGGRGLKLRACARYMVGGGAIWCRVFRIWYM